MNQHDSIRQICTANDSPAPLPPVDRCEDGFRPRVSILIPNYNNGRASSKYGDRDFITDLLESIEQTLADESTPFELLVFDDGSTDDSIDTLRAWAKDRTWASTGRPFLTLTEAPHCGVLSVTANKLSRAARGEFLVRLDGDIVCLTPNWVSKLCRIFDDGPPRLGMVGPKQLRVDGRIHAYGDWLLHPKGYHHIAHLMPADSMTRPLEVDHVMGCFYCCKKEVYDELGGYDEDFLRGQTVDFGMRARLAGWSCWAVPNIEYIHAHSERVVRSTTADTVGGTERSLGTFEKKWGFSRIATDMDVVRERYAGTPLLWNPQWTGPEPELDQQDESTTLTVEHSDWGRYANEANAEFRAFVDLRAGVAFDVVRQMGQRRLVVHYQAGHGLLGHIFAKRGVNYLGIDQRKSCIDLAVGLVSSQDYPGGAQPRFAQQTDRRVIPVEDESADLFLISDELEVHPNPVVILKEAKRITAPGGVLAIVSRRARQPVGTATPGGEHPYLLSELITQVMGVGGFDLIIDPSKDDPNRDMILVAQRRIDPVDEMEPEIEQTGSMQDVCAV